MSYSGWETHMPEIAFEEEFSLQCYDHDAPRLFDSQRDELDIIDSTGPGYAVHAIYGILALQGLLSYPYRKKQDIIYLVNQEFSYGRFCLSSATFNEILKFEKVLYPYLQAVRGFGSKLKDTQNTAHSIYGRISDTITDSNEAVSYEFCYNIPYPTLTGRSHGNPWSQRLTGVYHQLNLRTRRSSWILLQASMHTRNRIRKILENDEGFRNGISQNPMQLHLIYLSSTETYWAEYIEYLDAQLDDLDEKACFSRVGKHCQYDYSVTFNDYQALHLLRQKLLKASSDLTTCRDIAIKFGSQYEEAKARGLNTLDENIISNGLRAYKTKITSHQRMLTTISQRLEGTGTLLSKIMEFRDVETLRETNQAMQTNLSALQSIASQTQHENEILGRIAKQNQKDSTKLKALTLIATVYLPATLIATIFSSNLVSIVPAVTINGKVFGAHFAIFRQFWVYMLVTSILTMITLAAFLLLSYKWRKAISI